jgi:hypothetical protein
MSDGKYVFIN